MSKKQLGTELSTEPTSFKPTLYMEKWLETQQELLTTNVARISEAAGVARTNWYAWLKLPGFEDWYWAEYEKGRKRWKPTLDAIGFKYAAKGSYPHLELLSRKANDYIEKRSAVGVELSDGEKDVKVVVTRGTDE